MMSKLIILVFSLLGLLCACEGFVQLGQCDSLGVIENFNLQNFLGTWYEISRLDNENQNGDCSVFELTANGTTQNAYYSAVNSNFLEDSQGTFTQEGDTARLSLSLSTFQNAINFWVLMTDYTNYAVTYSCENISGSQRNIQIWVLGRERSFEAEMLQAFINTLITNTFNMDPNTLISIDHSENSCYVLPVIAPGQPIILPGQCDLNLPVVQNFDVARFLGRWHEISSYQSENSFGSCVRADYSLGAGVVNVLNSQVVNQELFTITGIASVSSTDQSAKLAVVLDIPGAAPAEQDLWILASDYDNYAISYSCVNVNENQKRIFSWILSRTRQMPASVQQIVDQTVDSYLELNYQYYSQTDQSDAGCFFYPEPLPNTPVVFRGQCETVDVQAMPNFDAARYMGLWHTIESYPSVFQTGTCSNAFYTLTDGGVDVLNTQVITERLDTINGIAIPVATDGSAKLVVSFPIAGLNDTTSTDYWVLSTDYDNYALVYSCSNLNADEFQVSTWKLSRTKQLSATSATAINNAMSTVNVLEQTYYEAMDQSVQGCFFYPEPQPGVPVVFPGVCDENIAVVQNFDFSAFQGIWHEIQAYPKVEQSGQCINHQYTFVNNNLLNLVSSSVDDQFLGITNGVVTRTDATDTSGKLTITFTSNGQTITIPFWILSTDYSDYAMAYACVNQPNDFRGVWSWKLSRTKQLSTAANTAINNIIATNVVLDNNYYENIDQSDDACFYLPEIESGEPIILPGQCDATIAGVPNFNLGRYAGRWRLIESYGSEYQIGTCNVARYTQESANTLAVTNSQVVGDSLTSISGTATISSTDGTGRLIFRFPNRDDFEFTVLDTDYDNYALGYGCVNLNNNERRVYSWKLSRDNTLSQNAINSINQVVNSIQVLNNRYYYTVDRSENACFYYPTPDESTSVRFRGQCDENIPVVTNFQPALYLGLWHDIQSYPAEFQSGTCNNAYYSPGNDVDVFNTQVINQTLDTINGVAVLDSTDGSAKLRVTFNVEDFDVTTNYWVLATDYISYSLVYSCQPIDDEYIRVTSWKLSRTKALTAAANTAINAVMNTIPVLDERYFITRDHTPEGCFYFPEPVPGVEVQFPGQCDDTIAAVPNFNLNSFAGTWYEIEAYPKDDQPGQCISHQFTVNANNIQLDLSSFNVLNQSLSTTSGQVTFASNDGSGRLNININVDGQAITIPFWILSTDYSDYALAYSCVNVGSDYRNVYSWKLSRSRQLTTAANTAINNAISNIDVLDNRYYEDIQQTDNACFYLPVLGPNDPVTFPGQCDPNIPVVQNFDAARYLGRWRLIQTYYSDFQEGTCNDATYSAAADGSVIVFNTEVVNQELETITGSAVLASTDGNGKLIVTFPDSQPIEYWILGTDYDSYALVYSCTNISEDRRRVWSWKMSRTNTLSATATTAINQIVDTVNVLDDLYYQTVDRTETGCFYYPAFDASTSVRFRGQCDENIPVVTNFQPALYLGLWHDIQSYPAEFQSGTCNNAYYSPGNDVDVFNTQVINQTLDTINGVAVLVSTDGSAKLSVTFNVEDFDVTTNYWVLATDYISYSLVYSCQPIDDEYIRVTSWKLSRTKALTAAANTAINAVMNTIPVLDERYFITRDHTPEGCFYFPEPVPGVEVQFPGQCDDTIAAVPNFNLNSFSGTWYEIEAYPKDDQPGQCISHQFTVNANNIQLDLSSFNVLNQSLSTTSGQVTFASNDGSGRLNININVDGQAITIPFWILSTDYSDYALAYSCVNVGSDYRNVYSWKLSRSRQLTTAANTAINNAISNIDVLDNRYYEDIQQTDNACFYLPVLGPNDPVTFPGQCDPNIPVVQNFDAARYLGRWRLIQTYYSDFQEGTCNDATYSAAADGSVIVFNTEVVNQELETITGSAVLASTDGNGKLIVTFPDSQPIEYWILGTDYDSYALVYSCTNISEDRRRVWSWKMSRTNTLSATATTAINQIVDTVNVLDDLYYQTVDRTETGCFYYPAFDASTSVRFRGQCDENIPVVTNFQPALYLGLWHDIQSYPAEFQSGTCNNAYYSPGNDVDVFNTQVINQTLDTINGVAVLVSTDGSAKLSVTFNVEDFDVTTNYWVLATDYISYSLVYSCQPIDDEYIRVTSWKLSRTKALTAAANTAINAVMNTIPVLDERYFITRDHTPEGCFYFPEPVPGVEVQFPGQCDDTIAAVPNFNLNSFSGTWYEIEAYPKDDQPGQCISHQFTVNANNIQLDLSSFNVLNQSLSTTSGQVTFASNDGSGRLNININVDGQAITIPFWILSTDYSDYALAYSCVNVGSDYRNVYSWKLSRSRQLTTAANTAINNAISNIDVLDNRYYENIQQTDNACFYLPVLGPNDPVTFPGQCDPNIPVVQNFDAARYLGRWRLIQTYYSDFQEGTCNDATYSAAADGSVIVFNTEVVNQELETITGSAVLASTDGNGKLIVTFPDSQPIEYWILGTDYDSYALVYSCTNISEDRRRVWSWKMSRTNTLSATATTAINQIVDTVNVLDDLYYQTVDRTDAGCFYYPTPDGTSTVIFPGQCDENIPVVQNFDPTQYTGTWFDIESYPTEFQMGTCNTATYTLNDNGTVDVLNTEIVDQILQITTGFAVVASTDGSAKLDVTFSFDEGDVTTKYWVLATDYSSYSLVYSCRNVDEYSRAVYVWKLGRATTLPAAATNAINNVINSVQVLEQQYFVQRSHTEEACFYYPDNEGGDVILKGQCVPDAQVPAMTNFNANSFAGTWHEVARFPSTLQNGECTATDYSLNGANSFNVVQTSVIDEALLSTTTQAAVTADGRGVISINVNGVPFDNVYILDTDYSEYALAYSCRNIDAENKQVYSWKLSRSRAGLSAAANTVIDELVTNNIDLFELYYRYTSQDDAACFYYPVFEQLPPTIVLPGPCNTSITAIPNFNAAAYLGRWLEVARYPQPAQTGQCNRAEYGDLGNGLVSVLNTQVIDQSLASMTGQASIASTDGSGFLEVTFVVNGEVNTASYSVLATDYNNYALVYSCINLPDGDRQVHSWKLSRSGTLSAEANAVMDVVISNSQGLKEDYYQPTSQSDESCFYVPPVDPTQAPLFRGQCEDITGVAGFDAQRFIGWWHEIERYPSDGEVGTCLSSLYETSGNTIQFVDTSISGVTASTVTGTVTVSADGRLQRVSGNNVQDVWVLATDYDNYALLYSCENVNEEYRRVWSAKHSKTRSLTPEAQQAMDPVIEANRLLYPQFYQTVDQSDGACFHYPVQAGPRVILPGQCDENIPAVGSFEIENFQGTWYQIERYDAVEGSSCVGKRLVYDSASGDINVLAYEVVDGELTTADGTGRINSTDGSGRLTLVMQHGDSEDTTETILHVLATDYENYALVYSCVNRGDFHREVGAWKLSRERTMQAAGASAINAFIETREELYTPYFKPISHDEDCPEPSSAYFIKSSIIVILVCAVLQLVR